MKTKFLSAFLILSVMLNLGFGLLLYAQQEVLLQTKQELNTWQKKSTTSSQESTAEPDSLGVSSENSKNQLQTFFSLNFAVVFNYYREFWKTASNMVDHNLCGCCEAAEHHGFTRG